MPKLAIPTDWTVMSMLEWGTTYLQEKQIKNPRLSIEWLLAHVLDCKRLDLYLAFDRPLTKDELATLKPMLLRRAKHEPVQYITGNTNFFGLDIFVNPAVLIPRPETEQLVELILSDHINSDNLRILDIGTGSGCISIAIKSKCPFWDVFAIDISEDAIKTAQLNATQHNLNIDFIQTDIFSPQTPTITQPLDIIVSNPPYIEQCERVDIDAEVKNFEPTIALFHENVSSVYSSIITLSEKLLKKEGVLYLEINQNHGEKLRELFNSRTWHIELKNDYNGLPRILKCRYINYI